MKSIIQNYSTMIKYLFAAGTSFFLDQALFALFKRIFRSMVGDYTIFISTVCARIISSFYNYFMNRNAVFQADKKGMDRVTFVKYYGLVIVQMFVSSTLVFIGYRLFKIDESLIKIPVDVVLFVINYFIQKMWIFKQS